MPDLSSAAVKLWRAAQHFQAAENLSGAFLNSKPYKIGQKQDGRWLVVHVVEVQPFPDEFALLIGDAAHNLRSSLDHIAFALVRPADAKAAGQVAFPTVNDSTKFRETARRRIPGVSAAVLAAIEKLQPYNSGQYPATKLLLQISSLNNWDKHRALPMTFGSFEMFRTDLSTDGTIEILGQELFKGRVELGTVITRYEIGKAERSAKVQVNAQLALQPIFDNGMPDVGGAAVLEVLRNAIGFIGEEIIPTFEKL